MNSPHRRRVRISVLATIAVLCAAGASAVAQTSTTGSQGPLSSVAPGQLNPCTLVTAAEASAILGRPIAAAVEGAQGPTCIYKPGGSQAWITLGIESKSFSKATSVLSKGSVASFSVAGDLAKCGKLGTDNLFVSRSNGTVLHVVAPCQLAQLFATKALTRLTP